jgi:hypothetical protein
MFSSIIPKCFGECDNPDCDGLCGSSRHHITNTMLYTGEHISKKDNISYNAFKCPTCDNILNVERI